MLSQNNEDVLAAAEGLLAFGRQRAFFRLSFHKYVSHEIFLQAMTFPTPLITAS